VNKNELVDAVASAANLKKSDATTAVDAVFDSITSSLKSGDEVRLVGFEPLRWRCARPPKDAIRGRVKRFRSRHRSNRNSRP